MSEDTTLREALDGRAIEAAACRIGTWTNQWRDPENGPFDGDESDYLRALAEAIVSTYLAAASQEREPEVPVAEVRARADKMLHVVCPDYCEASSWARGYGEALHELVTWLGEWQRVDDEQPDPPPADPLAKPLDQGAGDVG